MALGNLSGRIPRITSAMSPRLIYIGVALAVAGVCFVIYGFHYRIAKKQEQKSAATAQITSADAATSNRAAVQGSIPGTTVASNLGGTPTPTTAPPVSPASSVIASGCAAGQRRESGSESVWVLRVTDSAAGELRRVNPSSKLSRASDADACGCERPASRTSV